MPTWPLIEGQRISTVGTASSTNLTSNSSAASNTKTTYTEITSSTVFDAAGFLLNYNLQAGASSLLYILLDLAIGAAGSEQVILSNLALQYSQRLPSGSIFIPIAIPAGTRLAFRHQVNSASTLTVGVSITLLAQGFLPSDLMQIGTTYGAVTGTSAATQVDPGTSANTKGSWTEITSSTTYAHTMLLIAAHLGSTAPGNTRWYLDIGVGAAGSETVLVPDLPSSYASSGFTLTPNFWGPIPVNIPQGTRLSARLQSTDTSSARVQQVALYGF